MESLEAAHYDLHLCAQEAFPVEQPIMELLQDRSQHESIFLVEEFFFEPASPQKGEPTCTR